MKLLGSEKQLVAFGKHMDSFALVWFAVSIVPHGNAKIKWAAHAVWTCAASLYFCFTQLISVSPGPTCAPIRQPMPIVRMEA